MNQEWKTFLLQAGAVFEGERLLHFGAPIEELRAAMAGDSLCALSHLGLIKAHGADTLTFLQGQLTNDVYQVSYEYGQLTAYCSLKGRVLALFRLFQRDAGYYLATLREQVEPMIKRLRLFILRSQVRLEDASDELPGIGLSGPNAARLLASALGRAPAGVDSVVQSAELTAIGLPGEQPRFALYGPVERLQPLWQTLAREATPSGPEAWRLLDICAGLPTVYAATADTFVPQMINLQLLGGISLKKGCYVGQEVIARTHYLGQLKRRMVRLHIDSDEPPQPGARLRASAQGDDEPSAGQIVDAARHPDGGFEALAVLVSDRAQEGP
jgi:hypothetical protein